MSLFGVISAGIGLAGSLFGGASSNRQASQDAAFAREQVAILERYRPVVLANQELAEQEAYLWEARRPVHEAAAEMLEFKAEATVAAGELAEAYGEQKQFRLALEASEVEAQAADALKTSRLRVTQVVSEARQAAATKKATAAGSGFSSEGLSFDDVRRNAIANSRLILAEGDKEFASLTSRAAGVKTDSILAAGEGRMANLEKQIESKDIRFQAQNQMLERANALVRAGQLRTNAATMMLDYEAQLSAARHGKAAASLRQTNTQIGGIFDTAGSALSLASAWKSWKG